MEIFQKKLNIKLWKDNDKHLGIGLILQKQRKLFHIHFHTLLAQSLILPFNKAYAMNVYSKYKKEEIKYYLIVESTVTFINENLRMKN